MNRKGFFRQLRSLVLPFFVAVVVPFLGVARLNPFRIQHNLRLPCIQVPVGVLFIGLGLFLLVITIRLFAGVGRGTLAPWDPPKNLVTDGVYGHVRNPMISGGSFMILGESILLGSWVIFAWFLVFLLVNTIYFKRSEEPGLLERFGTEYQDYRANVPMWIPRPSAWRPRETNR
jgi:protein-S-isoprenylcysteine O-methyltransferase Ste14